MTCVLGICHKGRVLLGGDSSVSGNKGTQWICDDPKVWRAGQYAIGCAGSASVYALMRTVDLPAPPSRGVVRFMRIEVARALRKAVDEMGIDTGEEDEVLIGLYGKLYYVGGDFDIDTYSRDFAIGGGGVVAMPLLAALRGTAPPRQLAKRVLSITSDFRTDVRPPFRFVEV